MSKYIVADGESVWSVNFEGVMTRMDVLTKHEAVKMLSVVKEFYSDDARMILLSPVIKRGKRRT